MVPSPTYIPFFTFLYIEKKCSEKQISLLYYPLKKPFWTVIASPSIATIPQFWPAAGASEEH